MKEKLTHTSSAQITEQQDLLADLITNLHYEQQPELEMKYGRAGKERCKKDCRYHLSYLAEAVRLQSPEIFTGYLQWAQVMLQSRNIPVEDLAGNLKYLDIACRQLLTRDNYEVVSSHIYNAIKSLKYNTTVTGSFLSNDNPLLLYAKQYLSLLLKAKRKEAQCLIEDLLKNGQLIPDIYENIFAATQYEVGLLWQTNKITVAHEHYCTAATQLIMSTLYPLIFNAEKKKHKMLACTVSGGLHELGIRMISDFFERDGWDTYYMGASMPDINIISAIKEQHADILAVSISMPFDISKLETLINKIRSDATLNNLKIIVGGHPFNQLPELWKRVGADGWAKSAREAVELANQMMYNKKITV